MRDAPPAVCLLYQRHILVPIAVPDFPDRRNAMPNDLMMIEDLHRLAHILLKHRAYYPDVPWLEFLQVEEPEQWSRLSVLADVLREFYACYKKEER